MLPRLVPQGSSTPGYFDLLANSINITQDHITRCRITSLAPVSPAEPPDVMLGPRLRDISLMEFNRVKEAMAEGQYCVERALPVLQHYIEPTSGNPL